MVSRRALLIGALGFLPARAAVVAGQSVAPDEWRQFRGNPQLTGVAPSAPPLTLTLLWTYDTGDIIESSAAIAAGAGYVRAGRVLVARERAWRRAGGKSPAVDLLGESSPAIARGLVYSGDLAGTVHAV